MSGGRAAIQGEVKYRKQWEKLFLSKRKLM